MLNACTRGKKNLGRFDLIEFNSGEKANIN